MSADYSPAVWMPSPGRFWQGRNGQQVRWIILHGTAGGSDARAMGNWLNTQTERPPTSVHYVIGVDGTVVQLVSEADSAWGNGILSDGHDSWWSNTGNPNYATISIEHCKPNIDNSNELSPAQKEASFLLVRHLCEKHNIPIKVAHTLQPADGEGGITSHASIDPVNRQFCPGAYPWDALFSFLNGGGTVAGVPANWHDDGATLTAPNGIPVVRGNRLYVMGREWQADNVPLEAERAVAQTEWHAQLGSGVKQIFRRSILRWNPNREGYVLESDAGAEVQALERKVADLLAQLAAAQMDQADHQKLLQVKTIVASVQ